jgi:hypothetical protein
VKDFSVDLERQHILVYDFGAWDLIADHFSKKSGTKPEEFNPLKLNITTLDVPFLVWAGLSWEDPRPAIEDIKRELNAGIRKGKYSIMDLSLLVTEAIFAHAGMKYDAEAAARGEAGAGKKAPGPRRVVPGSKRPGKQQPT